MIGDENMQAGANVSLLNYLALVNLGEGSCISVGYRVVPQGQLTSSKGLVSWKQLSQTSLTAFSAVSVSGHAGFAATDNTDLLLTHA